MFMVGEIHSNKLIVIYISNIDCNPQIYPKPLTTIGERFWGWGKYAVISAFRREYKAYHAAPYTPESDGINGYPKVVLSNGRASPAPVQ